MTVEENKKQWKELLPIIQAWLDGKKIQFYIESWPEGRWEDEDNPSFDCLSEFYRIKPESNYRAFKNEEECWNEMMKHKPFGWVCSNGMKKFINIVSQDGIYLDGEYFSFDNIAEFPFKFIDGEIFAIKTNQ